MESIFKNSTPLDNVDSELTMKLRKQPSFMEFVETIGEVKLTPYHKSMLKILENDKDRTIAVTSINPKQAELGMKVEGYRATYKIYDDPIGKSELDKENAKNDLYCEAIALQDYNYMIDSKILTEYEKSRKPTNISILQDVGQLKQRLFYHGKKLTHLFIPVSEYSQTTKDIYSLCHEPINVETLDNDYILYDGMKILFYNSKVDLVSKSKDILEYFNKQYQVELCFGVIKFED